MSYYRSPDDLPGPEALGDQEAAAAGRPVPPVSTGPRPDVVADAEGARRRRKQLIIASCVVFDVCLVLVLLLVFVF